MKRKRYFLSDPAYTWPKITGIYCLENKTNGKKYIGKASGAWGFYHRWITHRFDFRHERHGNLHLMRSYKLYGEENFFFTIIEITSEENIVQRENFWIENFALNGEKIYNMVLINEENKVKPTQLGLPFELISPEGELIQGRNLYQFSLQNNLTPQMLRLIVTGQQESYKGYTSPNFTFEKITYRFLSPSKELHIVNNLNKFSIQYNLNSAGTYLVALGKQAHVSGWHLEDTPKPFVKVVEDFLNRKNIKRYVILEDNKIHCFKSISRFCEKYNCTKNMWRHFKDLQSRSRMVNGKLWKKPTERDMEILEIIYEDF